MPCDPASGGDSRLVLSDDRLRGNFGQVAQDCDDHWRQGAVSGVYTVNPGGKTHAESFQVWCDFGDELGDDGPWTVFMTRKDGSTKFFRTGWDAYVDGFGDPNREYWVGLDHLHRLTSIAGYERTKLKVRMCQGSTDCKQAVYNEFEVQDAASDYYLRRGTHDRSRSDINNPNCMANNAPFSTYDNDNDSWGHNCAETYHGGGWYTSCLCSNLMGQWGHGSCHRGPSWSSHWSCHNPLERVWMAVSRSSQARIRPKEKRGLSPSAAATGTGSGAQGPLREYNR